MRPLISVVHATFGRPRQALATRAYWMKAADDTEQIEWVFGVDADDEKSREVLSWPNPELVINDGPRTSIAASNVAFRASTGKVIIQCSDDYYAPPHWDTEVLKRLGDLDESAVLGTGDPICPPDAVTKYVGGGLLTMVCATRAYLEQIGYFYYPEYAGEMVDLDFTQKAAADHVLIDAYEDLHFYHDWHGGDNDPLRDAVHEKHLSDENSMLGVRVWEKRRAQLLPDLDGKPFDPDDARASFVCGDYELARRRVEFDLDYYKSFCGGRFGYHFGEWLRDECIRRLG